MPTQRIQGIAVDENFRGNRMRLTTEVVRLDGTGMNDRTQSAIVRDGVWEVCRDAYLNGGCIQLQPGRYERMDGNFVRKNLVGATNFQRLPVLRSPAMGQALIWTMPPLHAAQDSDRCSVNRAKRSLEFGAVRPSVGIDWPATIADRLALASNQADSSALVAAPRRPR